MTNLLPTNHGLTCDETIKQPIFFSVQNFGPPLLLFRDNSAAKCRECITPRTMADQASVWATRNETLFYCYFITIYFLSLVRRERFKHRKLLNLFHRARINRSFSKIYRLQERKSPLQSTIKPSHIGRSENDVQILLLYHLQDT